ncbi:MAG: IMP dehydrogenase, partial [Actinomycetota bacterium]
MEIEIGFGKSGRRAYGFDDIAIVPSRRTRDPEDVDISWELDAYRFELPLLASAMDGVVSVRSAIEIGRLGGLAVLNLEGVQTRYEDPDSILAEIAGGALTGDAFHISAPDPSGYGATLAMRRAVRD